MEKNKKEIVLTGDRPTGPLHLGHYVGSLMNRCQLQNEHQQFIMIADVQALTDNVDNPEKIRRNILEVALDYLAVGIDLAKNIIFIQSMVPELFELTIYLLNLVTVNRLRRNPTIKTEIQQKGYGDNIPAGFLMYPVSQAADIMIMKTRYVPVGQDQLPMIEQTNELVRTFNRVYNQDIFVEAQAVISHVSRLSGIDGKEKMGKSLGNAIFLSDTADQVREKVMKMYTDPTHVRVSDPGKLEGNIVFMYLDAFDSDVKKVQEFKAQYQHGGLGDVVLKKYLCDVLEGHLEPIRARRDLFVQDKEQVMHMLFEGTEKARIVARQTMHEVRKVMKLDY